MHFMDEVKKKLFETLYRSINGFTISAEGRKKLTYVNKAHTYGEVTFDSFQEILKQVRPVEGSVFYDLGSGTGKAVILSSLLAPFGKLVGVEIIEELVTASQKVLAEYEEFIIHSPFIVRKMPRITFVHGDFKHLDFSDADVIYLNATCLDNEIGNPLFRQKLEALPVGTQIITNSLPVYSAYYTNTSIGELKFSWGNATVYLHRKYR